MVLAAPVGVLVLMLVLVVLGSLLLQLPAVHC